LQDGRRGDEAEAEADQSPVVLVWFVPGDNQAAWTRGYFLAIGGYRIPYRNCSDVFFFFSFDEEPNS
jgi:hypothetical protein